MGLAQNDLIKRRQGSLKTAPVIFGGVICSKNSRVAQWKRAGPITQRSVDRNHALLNPFNFRISGCGRRSGRKNRLRGSYVVKLKTFSGYLLAILFVSTSPLSCSSCLSKLVKASHFFIFEEI